MEHFSRASFLELGLFHVEHFSCAWFLEWDCSTWNIFDWWIIVFDIRNVAQCEK